jgi:hypothetical protein
MTARSDRRDASWTGSDRSSEPLTQMGVSGSMGSVTNCAVMRLYLCSLRGLI